MLHNVLSLEKVLFRFVGVLQNVVNKAGEGRFKYD